MILVDTSVWVAFLRRRRPLDLEGLVDFDEVVTCPPVLQEVLQGTRTDRDYAALRLGLLALPCVDAEVPRQRYLGAADLYRTARGRGLTVRSGVDCLIAAMAIAHDLTVLHLDRDYDRLAGVSRLKVRHAFPGA